MIDEHTGETVIMMKEKAVGTFSGFLTFVREQGVVGLAVGFILGGAVSKLVSSIVNDIINPVIGGLLGSAGNLKNFIIPFGESGIMVGSLIATTIDFVIIAFVVYFGVRILKLDRVDAKKA